MMPTLDVAMVKLGVYTTQRLTEQQKNIVKIDYLTKYGVNKFLSRRKLLNFNNRNEDVVVYLSNHVTAGNGTCLIIIPPIVYLLLFKYLEYINRKN